MKRNNGSWLRDDDADREKWRDLRYIWDIKAKFPPDIGNGYGQREELSRVIQMNLLVLSFEKNRSM